MNQEAKKGGSSFASFNMNKAQSLISKEKEESKVFGGKDAKEEEIEEKKQEGTENKVFKPIEQFRLSLTEVTSGKFKGSVFNKAAGPTPTPPRNPKSNYLEKKRNSVFHKAFNLDS